MRQRPTVDVHGTSRTISAKNLNGPTDTQAAAFPGSVGSGRSGVVGSGLLKDTTPGRHSFLVRYAASNLFKLSTGDALPCKTLCHRTAVAAAPIVALLGALRYLRNRASGSAIFC
jgi:hypothetical protein